MLSILLPLFNGFSLILGHFAIILSKLQGVPQCCCLFCFVHFSASKAPRIKMFDIFVEPIQFWFQNCPYFNSEHKNWPNEHIEKKKTVIKNQHFSIQKNIFRICYTILIWEWESSQWVLNWTEGFWWILMGLSIIDMVIKGSKKVKLQFWVVLMVQQIC